MADWRFSTAVAEFDFAAIHQALSERAYWCKGIPKQTVEKAFAHSLSFGVFDGQTQLAFGRMITDRATFAYLADVFVLEPYRGQGLGKWMMKQVFALDDLQGLRRILLATQDAHGLYEQFGFKVVANPENVMTLHQPNIYQESLEKGGPL